MLRYCRAYPAESVVAFPAVSALIDPADDLLYLWDDLRLGVDPLDPDDSVVVEDAGWSTFCAETLGFAVPVLDG